MSESESLQQRSPVHWLTVTTVLMSMNTASAPSACQYPADIFI